MLPVNGEMTPNEIKVGNYEFYDFVEEDGQISFTVKGRDRYTISEEDEAEIRKILYRLGKWENMFVPIIEIINTLEIANIEKPIEEVNYDDYEIPDPGFYDGKDRMGVANFYFRMRHENRDSKKGIEKFKAHLQKTIKCKQLIDAISNLGLRDP